MNEEIDIPEPDQEWQVRHNPERSYGARNRRVVGIAILMVGILLTGMIGGIFGFVTLANSDQQWAREVRRVLKLDELSELRVPIRQDVRLEESSVIIDAAKKVSPAVVSVTASAETADIFGRVSNQEIGGGTGFIITSDGLIVTNKHVVSQQQATYKVVLNDGQILDATVKAIDPFNDLAVLKVEAKDLQTVELGSSNDLKIGQYVLAIGNALGEFQNSVSLGVVSAKDRKLDNVGQDSEQLSDLVQTDAAINPGNSGGPLVNLAGQVVGINTAIASTSGGSIGVGFAIAIDSVKSIIDSIRRTGEIVRPYIGVRYTPVTKALQRVNSLSVDYGALVSRSASNPLELAVVPGSPADKAGIVENDILLEINGERIDEDNSLIKRLQKYQVGEEISIKLLRKGAEQTVKVKLERLPSS